MRRLASRSSGACEEPTRQIADNAGHEVAVVIENIRTHSNVNYGFNAATPKYEDSVKAGVIDPTRVTRSALQNASSIASLMLTTEAMVCEPREDKYAALWNPGEGSEFGE